MRIAKAKPSWICRAAFATFATIVTAAVFACLELTSRGIDAAAVARWARP